jgi:DNA-binding NarL/FixJ family response regulator
VYLELVTQSFEEGVMLKRCESNTSNNARVGTQETERKHMTANETPIRTLIVDDHPVLREGLAAMLDSQVDMTLVAEASNGQSAIDLYRLHRPDVTIMDLRLPDMNGIEAITHIRAEFPEARIIVLTTYLGDVQAGRALKAGAQAFLLKATLRTDLLDVIRAVHLGKRRVPIEVASEIAEHAGDDALTPREIEVLENVASGHSNKIVADRLDISEETVKTHMRSILSKLGASDRTHAVTIALRRGFLDM